MYSVSDDIPFTSPIGATYVLSLDIFSYSQGQRPEIFSLSHGRQIFFDSFSVDFEIGSLGIMFNRATSLLNGENVVCFSRLVPDSRRRKRIPIGPIQLCGDTFNISIISEFKHDKCK